MQENLDGKNSNQKHNKKYEDKGELKGYVDETFLLNYLIMNELNENKNTEVKKEELSEKLVENMVQQVLSFDSDISLDDLKNIVGKQYQVIKYKQVTTTKKIEEIFNKRIDNYFAKIDNFKW